MLFNMEFYNHFQCKSSKYSIEKMEQEELKAAKKIQTPVVYNQG